MCGIVGAYSLSGEPLNHKLEDISIKLLDSNKNRGQDGFGLSFLYEGGKIDTYKFKSLDDIPKLVQSISQNVIALIGHARYPTSGTKSEGTDDDLLQPFSNSSTFEHKIRGKGFSFAFNGNILNLEEIIEDLEKDGYKPHNPDLDTSVLKAMILREADNGEIDIRKILESINNLIDGSCNIIMLSQDGEIGLSKDRWGIRPVSYANDDGVLYVSSEDHGLDRIGAEEINYLGTAGLVLANANSGEAVSGEMNLKVPKQKSSCFFERVYFANDKSSYRGDPISRARYRLGQALGFQMKSNGIELDRSNSVVIDVPDSSVYSSKGLADELRIDRLPAITKNPRYGRSFIAKGEEQKRIIEEKYEYNPNLRKHIEGKTIYLVDDSIVRGSTMKGIMKRIREEYNPKEIILTIPSPPIVAPCFYGINMPTISELIATKFIEDIESPKLEEIDEIGKYLQAEGLHYLSIEGLIEALRLDVSQTCMACITGKYPTEHGQRRYDEQVIKISA